MKKTFVHESDKFSYYVKESFKTLRTNFLFCGSDIKTVLITSCVKNEGKSTVSLELAKSLAISDKKVILIDCDLRKSVLSTKYTDNEEEVLGLSEFLSGQAEIGDVLYSTQLENLDIIFAGAVPPTPVELLGSAKFENLIKSMREQYDYVIVDAAPLGAVIDAAVIGSFCDGAAIVVSCNEISYRFAKEVKEQLERADCKILGVILNRVPTKSSSYYSRYYKKYYGKYSRTSGYGKYIDTYGDEVDSKKKKKKSKLESQPVDAAVSEAPVEIQESPVAEEVKPVQKSKKSSKSFKDQKSQKNQKKKKK